MSPGLRRSSAALLLALGACRPPGPAAGVELELDAGDPRRFQEVPDFEFRTQTGATLAREGLLGEPWIASLFFTSCAGPCPRLNADIRRYLYDELADTDVRIVSFTVDPERDTPAVLAEYARSFTADEGRWLFVTGEERELHELIRAGLMLSVSKPEGPVEAGGATGRLAERLEISHATRLVAVDPEGRIAGVYPCGGEEALGEAGLSPAEVETSFARLLRRVRHLDGRPAKPRSALPRVNAALNGLAAVLLLSGWLAIRRGRRRLHAALMRSAFVVSAAFLACYLYYHLVVVSGPTRFHGTGAARGAYLALLASHTILAVANLPLVLQTLWLAHKERWEQHRRLARWTLPIWMYVSVTGVLVYLVLYHWHPSK